MPRRSPWIRTAVGGALAALAVAGLWIGLAYVVAHATGSEPDHLVADIIVPLAGSPDRTLYADTLRSRRIAPAVGSTLVEARCLRLRGADPACLTGVRNTVDEAVVLRRLFEEERVRRAIVVTSRYHLARAAAVFAVVFAGTGIDVRFVAPPDAGAASYAVTAEVTSYLPSLGAAVLARVSPAAYEWSMERLGPRRCLHGASAARLQPSDRLSS